jgi:hypothetical protein
MSLPPPILIEPPNQDVMSLDDCKSALGISDARQDKVIAAALAAAVDALDPSTNGSLRRALRAQTWELQLESFDVEHHHRDHCWHGHGELERRHRRPGEIALPFPPLLKIVSVNYLDTTGADQALVLGTDYRVLRLGAVDGKQSIVPAFGKTWPRARSDYASIRIRYTCGYDDEQNVMPHQLKQAICLGVRALMPLMQRDQMLFEDRVEGVSSKRYQNNPEFAKIVEDAVCSLLGTLRVF